METQFDNLSDDELEAFAAQAHEKLKTRREAKKLEAAREAKRLLDSVGLTFRDAERLAGSDKRKAPSAKKSETPKGARFVNPADSSQSWTSGRGRKPKWLQELEARGEAPNAV